MGSKLKAFALQSMGGQQEGAWDRHLLPAPGLSSMFQTSCDRESSLSHLFMRFRWESVARDWKTQKGAKWDPEFPGLQQQTYLMGFFK